MSAMARDAVERFPDRLAGWERLAATLLDEHAAAAAVPVLNAAIERFPRAATLQVLRARAARMLDDRQTALEASSSALALAPTDPGAILERFEALCACGAWDEATPMLDRVLRLPNHQAALGVVTRALTRAGRLDDAVALLQRAVARTPHSAEAVYLLGLTLSRVGRSEEACRLIDVDRYVSRIGLEAPLDWRGAGAFRRALLEEVQGDPTLAPGRSYTSTRDGLQTLVLSQAVDGALSALVAAIQAAVDAYVKALPAADPHPFVQGRPLRAILNPWAVVYPERGRQMAHIHPNSWLSGVYYVAVPPPGSGHPDGGALVLGGAADETTGEHVPWKRRTVLPSAGDLVLFPSWLPHATRPTGSRQPRVSVSFDVVPVRV